MKKRIYISYYIEYTPQVRAYLHKKKYAYESIECSSIDEANSIAAEFLNCGAKDVKVYRTFKFIQTIKNFINR